MNHFFEAIRAVKDDLKLPWFGATVYIMKGKISCRWSHLHIDRDSPEYAKRMVDIGSLEDPNG
jgi:hypothetical protein